MLHSNSSIQTDTPVSRLSGDEQGADVQEVDAAAARRLISSDRDIVVLDLRMPVELEEGRIADGINVDFFEDDFADELDKLDRATHYLVHCRCGGRSRMALDVMKTLGFEQISHMECGFDGWRGAGFPVAAG